MVQQAKVLLPGQQCDFNPQDQCGGRREPVAIICPLTSTLACSLIIEVSISMNCIPVIFSLCTVRMAMECPLNPFMEVYGVFLSVFIYLSIKTLVSALLYPLIFLHLHIVLLIGTLVVFASSPSLRKIKKDDALYRGISQHSQKHKHKQPFNSTLTFQM